MMAIHEHRQYREIESNIIFFKGVIDTLDRKFDREGQEYSFYDLKEYTGMDLDDFNNFIVPSSCRTASSQSLQPKRL